MKKTIESSLTPGLLTTSMLVQPSHDKAGNGEWNQKALIEAIFALSNEQFDILWEYIENNKRGRKLLFEDKETFSLTLLRYYLYLLKVVNQDIQPEKRVFQPRTMQLLGRALFEVLKQEKI